MFNRTLQNNMDKLQKIKSVMELTDKHLFETNEKHLLNKFQEPLISVYKYNYSPRFTHFIVVNYNESTKVPICVMLRETKPLFGKRHFFAVNIGQMIPSIFEKHINEPYEEPYKISVFDLLEIVNCVCVNKLDQFNYITESKHLCDIETVFRYTNELEAYTNEVVKKVYM